MGMPSWLENIVFYEIYPQTFLDTDGDGIGCEQVWLFINL